ncbi:hypothetical protein EJD97_020733, partial [Solanum chilense]
FCLLKIANNGVRLAVVTPTQTVVAKAEEPGEFIGVNFKEWQHNAITASKQSPDALEKKYNTEDACLKKFVVEKFLDYKMVDNMVVNEAFQVAALIKKLPPSWNDFKNYLKHKRREMKLQDLVIRLKIEEDNKNSEMKSRKSSIIIVVNIVEEAPTKDKKRMNSNRQKSERAKKKFKGNCYNCGKDVHRYSDCRAPIKEREKDKAKSQAIIVEKMEDADYLC